MRDEMNGLDKIISKIISEAEEAAKQTKQQAELEISAIEEESGEIVKRIVSQIETRTKREEALLASQAESSAAMAKRNIILDAKSKMLEETYKEALSFFLRLSKTEYVNFLVKILTGTLSSRLADLAQMKEYGEDYVSNYDDLDFEIVLNEPDKKNLGDTLLSQFKDDSGNLFDKTILKRVKISEQISDIPGGLILKHGDVEANCAIDLLIERIRPELDSKVYAILFS